MNTLNGVPIQGMTGGMIRFKTPHDGQVGDALAGYVSPNLQGVSFNHKGDVGNIPNQGGAKATLYVTDEWIELTFDYIQMGSTTANALASAQLPPLLSKAEICGLPVFPIGSFADGLNTHTANFAAPGTSTQPWIYEGDGDGSGKAKEHWDGKLTLRRYLNIPSSATYAIV